VGLAAAKTAVRTKATAYLIRFDIDEDFDTLNRRQRPMAEMSRRPDVVRLCLAGQEEGCRQDGVKSQRLLTEPVVSSTRKVAPTLSL